MIHAPDLGAIQDRRCIDEMLPAPPRRDALFDTLREDGGEGVPEELHCPTVDEVGLFRWLGVA